MSSHSDAEIFHLAGLDGLPRAFDPQVAPAYDPSLSVETQRVRDREHVPQLGPDFVTFVHDRFTKLDELMTRALMKWSEKPTTFFAFATFNSDGSGNVTRAIAGSSVFLEPPPGWTMTIHRLSIQVSGSTFGAPFTGAGGYWELRVNDEAIDGGSLVSGSGSFPVVRTWGTRDAPHVRDGELASLFVSGGPVSKAYTLKAQGTQVREAEG